MENFLMQSILKICFKQLLGNSWASNINVSAKKTNIHKDANIKMERQNYQKLLTLAKGRCQLNCPMVTLENFLLNLKVHSIFKC